jgi:putative tricarboxylic transport membrane protein
MADRVIFVCTLVLAGVYIYATEQLPSLEIGDPLGPKAFPRLLAIGLVITAVVLLLEILRNRKGAPPSTAQGKPKEPGAPIIVAGAAAWTLLYFIAFETLGFVLSTAVYLLVLTSYFNRGKLIANALTSILFAVGAYVMFTKILGVTLPPGFLPFGG